MKKSLLLSMVAFSSLLSAGSVRLLNDSAYPLRAVVRGADGSYLGEQVVQAQNLVTWSDNSYGAIKPDALGGNYYSQTPYTILWYCMSGDSYSISTNIGTGATTTAQGGVGNRLCIPKTNPEQLNKGSPQEGQVMTPPPPLPQNESLYQRPSPPPPSP